MDESGLGWFEIAGKNYSKEELKDKVENFLQNLIKTNEFVPKEKGSYDPDEVPFQVPISQEAIDFFVDVCGHLDLSTWNYIEYYSYRSLGHTYNGIELCCDGINKKLCVTNKFCISNILIEYFTSVRQIRIIFNVFTNINSEGKCILLDNVNDFIQIYNEVKDGTYSECEKIPDNA